MLKRNSGILSNLDWWTVGIYFALIFIGWINIYAAVFNQDHQSIFDISQRYGKQLLWIGAAVVLIVLIFFVDSRFYVAFPYPVYFLVMLLLLFVLAFGREVNGAKSWLELGAFRLQPAEFAKLAAALALAKLMSNYNFKLLKFKNLLIVGVIVLLPAFLILLQNDTGSALVYVTFVLVLYREGLPAWILVLGVLIITFFILALLWGLEAVSLLILVTALVYFFLYVRQLKLVLLAAAPLLVFYSVFYLVDYYTETPMALSLKLIVPFLLSSLFYLYYAFRKNMARIYAVTAIVFAGILFVFSVDYVFNHLLVEHQRDRINNLLGIEFDPLGAGYNVNQSLIAIGSGGAYGKGFLQGTQTKYDFVPEQSTDFIFCTVGEEWGFVGTSIILLLFLALLFRIVVIAERQKSKFSRIYAYAVASIFFFHILINIGMTIGLAPVIGIPLPFISYGGSSLWAFTILLFILLRLDVSRNELLN